MSVLNEEFASPGRVKAVYRYLLARPGQASRRLEMEAALAPKTLGGTAAMCAHTIDEAIKAGLLISDGDGAKTTVSLSPELPKVARDPAVGSDHLPDTLVDLFFASPVEENHNLGIALAWFLSQDIYRAPGTNAKLDELLRDQKAHAPTTLNETRLNQMAHWAVFLGFAGRYGGLLADPTAFIRRRIKGLFEKTQRVTMPAAMKWLSEICPIFEGGVFREQIEAAVPAIQPEPRTLSTATAHAWLRLQDEQLIKLTPRPDADVRLLPTGPGTAPEAIAEVTWIAKNKKGAAA